MKIALNLFIISIALLVLIPYVRFKPKEGKFHVHKDENGFLVRCYHQAKPLLLNWKWWASLTFSFPIEHALWEHVWPFKLFTQWMGL